MTESHSRGVRLAVFAAIVAAAVPAFAAVPITAVPPAPYRPAAVEKAAPQKFLLAPGAPVWRIGLPEPSAAERAMLKSRNAAAPSRGAKSTTLKGPLALAFPRTVPVDSAAIALDHLAWQPLADGSRAAKIEVVSPGAAAMRVELALSANAPGITLRFAGNGSHAEVFGPVAASTIAGDAARSGGFWSPVLEGDVATLEIHAAAGAGVASAVLTVTRVSHQVVAPTSLEKMSPKDIVDIGTSGSCNIDIACVTPQSSALVDARHAVAEMEFTKDDGFTYLCTGQLLNDSLSSNTPYFLSASHCIDSATAAQTLNTFWFFDAVTCGSLSVPPFVQQATGAALLARSVDWDWALVRLNAPPPPGSHFSAWRAEPIPTLATITVLHHPEGDLKKFSQGSMQGYQSYSDGSSFAQVQYSQGTTERGSSGAGLLTFFAAGGYYEVRGGLFDGAAACTDLLGVDEYSRLDNMLPLTRGYLTPNTPGTPGQAVVVEFYNRDLDHYFMTIAPNEISDLDNGVHPGWVRTGLRFMAYQVQAADTNPVCRFYRTPGYGNSHFYSASPAECQAVLNDPRISTGWTYESPNVFYIALPDPVSGACPAGALPVWRFFNAGQLNHRYTADHATRDDMRADPATWTPEGYGPDQVIMCSPVGT